MMAKKSTKPDGSIKDGIEIEIGGLFSTLGTAVDLLGRLTEAGAKHVQQRDDLTVEPLDDEARGVYGLSIRTGRGGAGADNVEPFRNIHAATEGVVADDVREPLVDVFDEGTEIVINDEVEGDREDEGRI